MAQRRKEQKQPEPLSLICLAGTRWHCEKLISNIYLSSRGCIFTSFDFDVAVPVPGGW